MKVMPVGLVLVAAVASGQDVAKQRLEASPRHHEWAVIKAGDRSMHVFVAYPEAKAKTPVVVVLHENRGLDDWARSLADQVAEAGYLAVAPDLLSGAGPGGGRTSDFSGSDAAREAISKLAPDQVTADLEAVADFAAKLPVASGKVAVAGFCWGGAQAFRFATNRKGLAAAFVFYGSAPQEKDALARIAAPVYGFYGGGDARITSIVPQVSASMKELGKTFEPVTYEGAGHGFMRAGEQPDASEANRRAREQAWTRWKALLKGL